jgi:hypothetical protein
MPDVSATGTYTHETPGFEFLDFRNQTKSISFAGNTLPTDLSLQYTDDEGVDRILESGVVVVLPKSIIIGPLNVRLKLVVTGGSPDFNISSLGADQSRV